MKCPNISNIGLLNEQLLNKNHVLLRNNFPQIFKYWILFQHAYDEKWNSKCSCVQNNG